MRKILGFVLLLMASLVAACQVTDPPTQIVMEVTSEVPVTVIHTVVVTPMPQGTQNSDTTPMNTAPANATTTSSGANVDSQTVATQAETTPMPEVTETITSTPLPVGFPTTTVGQVFTAEQAFQNGRMFWLEPVQQIWVLTADENENQVWLVYNDTWEEGMPEADEELVPPEAGLQQPVRGFGKLWRENNDVRNLLGWAVDPELGFVTRYEFYPGGEMVDGEYVSAPGYHKLQAYNGDILIIDEASRTWSKVGNVRQ